MLPLLLCQLPNTRLVFVMEKNDQFASEATRLWSIEDFSTKEGAIEYCIPTTVPPRT